MKNRLSGPTEIPAKKRKIYLLILLLGLIAIWLLYETLWVKEEVFIESESYTFGSGLQPQEIKRVKEDEETRLRANYKRTGQKAFTTEVKANFQERLRQEVNSKIAAMVAVEVKEKIKAESRRFQSAISDLHQITALVHMLECNYYLLYNRHRSMSRYYDFLKVVTHPLQRKQLKNKQSYIRQAKRFLKRKRNLEYRIAGYQVSKPRSLRKGNEDVAEVLVLRRLDTSAGTRSQHQLYHFRKHTDNRYYLYFEDERTNVRFRFIRENKTPIQPTQSNDKDK